MQSKGFSRTPEQTVWCLLPPQMQMPPVRQAELHSDLKIQEKDELQWKKLKVEGLDESGEKEAQLRRNFHGEPAPGPLQSGRLSDGLLASSDLHSL